MTLEVNGLPVHYKDEGTGECMVLLHGWGANVDLFQTVIDLLKPHYRVIALDFPGFGQTPEPPEAWTVEDYTLFTIEFLKKLGIEKASLVAHSFGGRVVLKMVTRDCGIAFDQLILVDIAGIKPQKTKKQKRRQRRYKVGKAILGFPLVKFFYPEALERLRRSHGSADYNSATPRMRQTLVKVVNEDLSHLLPLVKQNTLLVWGDMDTATPLSDGQTMERTMQSAGLAVIKGAGHFSYLEQPAIFAGIVKSFLKIEV